ncbi:MAG TPA: pilus assembly protein PilP, partial [Thermomonas sp.]|nr:pilus assembly protein PilP [Thermomonas sp.]
FKQFSASLGAAFPGADPGQYSFLAHAYDAAYLGAFGVVYATSKAETYDGRDVAEGLAHLEAGTALAVGAVAWPGAKQTLEQFPLDSLDMVGTLGNGKGLVALVMAPDKVTYRVQPGAYLGQSDGRVTAINEDRVELVELVPDGAGGWLERPATILLEDN